MSSLKFRETALSHFSDGNLASLPPPVTARLREAVRNVDLGRLPPILAVGQAVRTRGLEMKLRLTDELREAARRGVWFEPPERAIANPARLAAYILTYGAPSDVAVLRAQVSDDQLRALLDAAPPGIFDGRSWAYWNLVVGRSDAPPLPVRSL